MSNHYCFDILFQAGKVKSQETVLLPNLDRNQLMLQVEPLAGALVKTLQVHHDDIMIQKIVLDLICCLCSLHTFPSVSSTVFFLLNMVNFYKLSLSWLQLTKIITDAFWLWVSFLGNNCVASIFWMTVSALLITGLFMKTLLTIDIAPCKFCFYLFNFEYSFFAYHFCWMIPFCWLLIWCFPLQIWYFIILNQYCLHQKIYLSYLKYHFKTIEIICWLMPGVFF